MARSWETTLWSIFFKMVQCDDLMTHHFLLDTIVALVLSTAMRVVFIFWRCSTERRPTNPKAAIAIACPAFYRILSKPTIIWTLLFVKKVSLKTKKNDCETFHIFPRIYANGILSIGFLQRRLSSDKIYTNSAVWLHCTGLEYNCEKVRIPHVKYLELVFTHYTKLYLLAKHNSLLSKTTKL